jgi:hypothetical protein
MRVREVLVDFLEIDEAVSVGVEIVCDRIGNHSAAANFVGCQYRTGSKENKNEDGQESEMLLHGPSPRNGAHQNANSTRALVINPLGFLLRGPIGEAPF